MYTISMDMVDDGDVKDSMDFGWAVATDVDGQKTSMDAVLINSEDPIEACKAVCEARGLYHPHGFTVVRSLCGKHRREVKLPADHEVYTFTSMLYRKVRFYAKAVRTYASWSGPVDRIGPVEVIMRLWYGLGYPASWGLINGCEYVICDERYSKVLTDFVH